MEGGKREGVRRMEGSEVVCSVKVWCHVYASLVHLCILKCVITGY